MTRLGAFCTWLAHTGLSKALGAQHWITPALQTVHILAVAAVLGAVLVVDVRLLGRTPADGFPLFVRRYTAWIWRALAVLLATGSLLVIGEPVRSLQNPVFAAKIALVIAAAGLTAAAQGPIRVAAETRSAYPTFTRPFAAASLVLWVAVVFAGRWIAYV
jgi:hypothetical protein